MFSLPNYIINNKIYENDRIVVYRGCMVQDRSSVVIKALKEEAANPAEISKMLYEYEITRNLDLAGVIRPKRLERNGACVALIMEDGGAVSLRKRLLTSPPDLAAFFPIAVQLADILGEIHRKGIFHRDIKPDNILIHPDTGNVKIIDFSTAVLFTGESENAPVSSIPAGTLEYMSPEQTGRISKGIDCRSDLYSLGVVFYEMLTGQLPWQAENPAEWVYAHMARLPAAPEAINPAIPPVLSAIIMKLLAKTAEERYQSAGGLLWDLQECRRQWSRTGKIEPFSPGRMDVAARFQLPSKLYGREKEQKALTAAFERLCVGQAGIVLVSGYAGVGKTMLINETLKPLTARKGYFITGKFDQLRQNNPYAPFAYAFGNLIRRLMTESRENLDMWRGRIQRCLGRNGAVITGVIPEVELIVGTQPPIEILQPKEAQNRFFIMFRKFISIFAKKDHPLVIFLDDLQWADPASLQLIRYLCDDIDNGYLLLIGAWRDNEISEKHTWAAALEDLRKEEVQVWHIPLSTLDCSQVKEFIAGALRCPPEKSNSLAEALYRKSAGNPFFLGQLLQLVYDEKLLRFNEQYCCWEWELESVQRLQVAEDVVALILGKLQKLPEETLNILKIAACIGSTFDLPALSIACGKTPAEAVTCLLPAVLEGLVLPQIGTGEALTALYHMTGTGLSAVLKNPYEFLHDRVQQAVYSLIPEEERKEAHLNLGRLILQNTGADELNEKILPIMDHFNRSLDLLKDPAERLKLAEYNLQAGRKAKASTANEAALSYLRAGIALLPDNMWDHCYQLSCDLHLERAQCEYLLANVGIAEQLFDIVIERAETELERAGVYGLKMVLEAGMGNYAEAAQIGIYALREFGVKLPLCPGKFDYIRELLLYKWFMRNKSIGDLVDLPEMKDPVQRKVAELLIRLACVTSTSNTGLYGLTIIKVGNHAVKYGNTVFSSIGYVGYSITAGSVLGDYAAGYDLAKVSISLAEKYDQSFSKCIVYFVVGAIISHWTQPGKNVLAYLRKAVRYGLEAGDLLITGYARSMILDIKYFMGSSLEEILEETQRTLIDAARIKHENLVLNTKILQHLVSALRGQKKDSPEVFPKDVPSQEMYPCSLGTGTAGFDSDGLLMELIGSSGDKSTLSSYYYYKMQWCYLFGYYDQALSAAEKIKNYTKVIKGFMIFAEYKFCYSLAITAIYEELPARGKKSYWKILKKNQRQMKKWSDSCRENFFHKYLLVAAEMARLGKRGWEAMPLYDQSIQAARENGCLQQEALANELAAKFYLAAGREKIARTYLRDACLGYKRWGAAAKAIELTKRYPDLLNEMAGKEEKNNTPEILENILRSSSSGGSEAACSLDMYTIRKAAQNISEETDPDKLLISFLEMAIESAGADRGYLILEKNGELYIEAAKDCDNSRVMVLKPTLFEKSAKLARTVVRYVARTLETVVLDGADQAGIFAGDPYLDRSSTRSIACLPVLFQGIPAGALYLENSLMVGVFTPDRLEVLKLLSTHMAYVKKLQSYLTEDTGGIKKEAYSLQVEPLTERETEVLELIVAGMSNKEIAGRMEISINTVKGYIKNIYGKLGVNRRVQVVARGRRWQA